MSTERARSVARLVRTGTGRLLRRTLFLATIPPLRRYLRARWEGPEDTPPVGLVRFGDLRRPRPIGPPSGQEDGLTVEHWYIDRFMEAHRSDIRGRALELGEGSFARRLGRERVTHVEAAGSAESGRAVADALDAAGGLPSGAFDCIVAPQALQLVYDVRSAVRTLYRILAPGGVALVTVPGIARTRRSSCGEERSWSFTALSMRKLFTAHFSEEDVRVGTHGNVLAAAAYLYGVPAVELTPAELEHRDPDYELLVTIRAEKPGSRAHGEGER